MATFPDNNFSNDQLDVDAFGGNPKGANNWGTLALLYVTGLLRAVAAVVLANVRVSWSNAVVTVQNSVAIGDVLAMDLTQDRTDPTTQVALPYIDKYSTVVASSGAGAAFIVGVAVTQAAAGSKCQIANGGPLPPSITGLPAMTAGALVAADVTTSRLRAWTSADDSIGAASPKGSIYLQFSGRASS